MKWTAGHANPVSSDFQTPPEVCRYMVSLIPKHTITVLEPTPGDGNIVKELTGYHVTAPTDFFELDPRHMFDCIVMNPPFSSKTVHGNIPTGANGLGMRVGYYILSECMKRSGHIIALMPWFTITDSDVRLREMKKFGLKSVTALPRKTFKYSRIQTCVFELHRGWHKETKFKMFEF